MRMIFTIFPRRRKHIADVANRVWMAYIEKNLHARTVTLKIKFSDFRRMTRATSLKEFVSEKSMMWKAALHLLQSEAPFAWGSGFWALPFPPFPERKPRTTRK